VTAFAALQSKLALFAILRIDWDRVSKIRVALYREEDGSCPFIEWFDKLPAKVQDKCYLRLERLREMGHELRRPEADFLRDGIYELRASLGGVHHRILYFFHGTFAAVVSHGLVKERAVPAKEIDRAVERKKRFEADAPRHIYPEARHG
jgi:phage-related protein